MPLDRPDVLVLAGGGTLGEAWMRRLLDGAATAAGIDFRECEYFVGTSAGSIVAAFLAAGRAPDSGAEARAARDWANAAEGNGERPAALPHARTAVTAAAAAPLAPIALATATPGGAVARAAALRAAPRTTRSMPGLGRLIDAEGARFDGRLRIVAVDRRNGRRVVFGAPDAPAARVGEAVLASCSVPWIFAPVEIGGREYVDGGVWSPTNLDATPARRGTRGAVPQPDRLAPGHALGVRRAARVLALGRAGGDARAAGARRDGAHDRARRPRRRGDGREPDGPRPRRRGAGRRLRPGQGAGGMSHQDINRALWDGMADQWVEPGRRDWATPDPHWGMWRVPEAEIGALPDVNGLDTIELGCGTAYFSGLARPPRRAARRHRPVARASSPPPARCRRSTASSSR